MLSSMAAELRRGSDQSSESVERLRRLGFLGHVRQARLPALDELQEGVELALDDGGEQVEADDVEHRQQEERRVGQADQRVEGEQGARHDEQAPESLEDGLAGLALAEEVRPCL